MNQYKNQNQVNNLYASDLLPRSHKEYLRSLTDVNPKVIYDIGSCVLHWTKPAQATWPNAKIICFDAIHEIAHLYKGYDYYQYVLSDKDGEQKTFYKSLFHLGGNSLYQENEKVNANASIFFGEDSKVSVVTHTLDTVVAKHNIPSPDFIKIDVQGSELDILKGATKTIENCRDIILELQTVDYNKGAPKAPEAIEYMRSIGYACIAEKFSENKFDADYHFRKTL